MFCYSACCLDVFAFVDCLPRLTRSYVPDTCIAGAKSNIHTDSLLLRNFLTRKAQESATKVTRPSHEQ